jgi:hypothetical protein
VDAELFLRGMADDAATRFRAMKTGFLKWRARGHLPAEKTRMIIRIWPAIPTGTGSLENARVVCVFQKLAKDDFSRIIKPA